MSRGVLLLEQSQDSLRLKAPDSFDVLWYSGSNSEILNFYISAGCAPSGAALVRSSTVTELRQLCSPFRQRHVADKKFGGLRSKARADNASRSIGTNRSSVVG